MYTMARSFSSVKIMSTLVSDGFCNALFRRGYAAAATATQGGASGAATGRVAARSGNMMKNREEAVKTTEKVSWIPDPVTGYYRPENFVDEIDPVDLRAMLLKPTRK